MGRNLDSEKLRRMAFGSSRRRVEELSLLRLPGSEVVLDDRLSVGRHSPDELAFHKEKAGDFGFLCHEKVEFR